MSDVKINILGGLEVAGVGGKPLTRKAKAVAAFLALQCGHSQSRERLADLFWQGSQEEQARTNLRQCLSTLRKHLGAALVTDGDGVILDRAAVDLDVERFKRLIGKNDIAALEDAAALYTGDLLDGFALKEDAFEAWIRPERERYRGLMIDGMIRLIGLHEAAKDAGAAAKSAARLLALDPLNEDVHRTLMRAYAAQGRHGVALKQFETCRDILRHELGVEPELATVELFHDIRRRRTSAPEAEGEATEGAPVPIQAVGPPLPEEPSIAVLPFTNMISGGEEDFFADGISEDIITALSKISSILVIARNSSFTYKGSAVDVKQVGREQGVRYVLEGSVRRAGKRTRVTAQLVNAISGHHLWAERFDRDLEDIFAIQDEITREIVVALDVHLREGEQARVWSHGTKNVEAWECVRLGMDAINQVTPEGRIEARRLIERALELDPNYPMAWVSMGWIYFHEADLEAGHETEDSRKAVLQLAEECVPRAVELDPSCPDAYALLGLCRLSDEAYDDAIAAMEKAVALAPNHAENLAIAGAVLNKSGQPERSFELINRAMRLCPIYPGWYLYVLATACRLLHRNDAAVSAFEQGIARNPDNLSMHVGLASTLGELDREKEARESISEIFRLYPDFAISKYAQQLSYRDPAELARFEEGLRKAGLPK
jgi:TolB-like protein/Tfp pilus assembly protein PilF